MEPEKEPEPFQFTFGPNIFILKEPITALEQEALMNFETWTWWQLQWWRIRYRANKTAKWYQRMKAKIEWLKLRY